MALLSELVDLYLTVRPISKPAQYLFRRTVELYGEWLERPATAADLTDQMVSRWLEAMERGWVGSVGSNGSRRKAAEIYSAETRRGHRTRLMCLWRLAARKGMAAAHDEVRQVAIPEPMPEAWTADEVRRLLKACDQLPEGKAYFRAKILAAYELGARKSDLERLHRSNIPPGGGEVVFRQKKTTVPHVAVLSETAARAILALPGVCPLAIPWGTLKHKRLWDTLKAAAGVTGRGGCQKLRRTGASAVAAREGVQAAREFLGHRTSSMVFRYVDRRIAPPPVRRPPSVV